MKIAGIIRDSIVNGQGIRDVIFVQGCPHRCKGCHNPQTWDFTKGEEKTIQELIDELRDSPNDITISGGEPFYYPIELCTLIGHMHWTYPKKTFWIYTGYKIEELNPNDLRFLSKCNVEVIVDGEYEEDKRDTSLRFRGSSNQRIIDLKQTVKCDYEQIVLWEDTE